MPRDTTDLLSPTDNDLLQSYRRVRRALGLLGLLLPLLLIIGGLLANSRLEPSISDFYHTTLRDILVGSLFAIGIFLISYRGYPRHHKEWISDDWVATIAGVSAFGVALFPNESPSVETISQQFLGLQISPLFHYISAFVLFICFAAFCYVKFPKTTKPVRRRIYITCGHVIVLSIVLTAISSYYKINGAPAAKAFVNKWDIVFWAEAIGVWAFAFSWLTKGRAEEALRNLKITGKKTKRP
ncbi:MAG TPA: DUF998 domain-containing protein [Rhodobacteraceae bacterium]|nr:DUF998 domain-containing protein [Paracoccaceae bacterium]